MKKYTYADLKMFLELLDEEQLKQAIQFAPEDEPVFPIYPSISQDDLYYNTDEYEDCGTMEELRLIHEGEDDFDESNYKILFPKGTVLFYQN